MPALERYSRQTTTIETPESITSLAPIPLCVGGPVTITVGLTVTEIFVLRFFPTLVGRGRITNQISLFFGAHKQTQIGKFFIGAEMSLSIATASGLSAACFNMFVVRQQRKPHH